MDSMIDFNHLLYLHPSDAPGGILVAHRLSGIENYNIWSYSMKIALLAKNKLVFVDGSCKKGDYEKDLKPQWERCNAFVLSWILNTVTSELSAGIVFSTNAAQVWQDLKERFDKVDESRIYFLHREIAITNQGESTVSSYFTRLKLLWDEYNAFFHVSTCNCEASNVGNKHLAQQSLFQFLMGLNETFAAIRSQILLMSPLLSVNQDYSMIVQEESQRLQLLSSTPLSDATTMFSNSGGKAEQERFNGLSNHCNVRGHKKENWYKLHGFPANYKFTKKKGLQGNITANTQVEELKSERDENPSNVAAALIFTKDQYNQILKLLNRGSASDTVANMAGTVSQGPLRWKDEGDW